MLCAIDIAFHSCLSAVRAVVFVSRLNGASQPSIVMTTRAGLYVLKLRDFSGPFGLINESVGAALMRLMGLPVPEWRPMQITDEFLDRNRGVWFRGVHGNQAAIRPTPGLHFGSRVTLSSGGAPTYQIVPASWAHRIANRSDYVGALLLDLWTNHCDRRQSLLLTDPSTGSLRAVFIDNDNLFGGFHGDETTCPQRIVASSLALYEGVWTEKNIAFWKRKIDAIDETTLDAVFAAIPREWADPSRISAMRAQLRRRRRLLESLIDETSRFFASHRASAGESSAALSPGCLPPRRPPARATSSLLTRMG